MASDNRTVDNFINDLTKILSCKGLHMHTRRAVLYKAIEDHSKILKRDGGFFWSVMAQQCDHTEYILEHPVPKSVITDKITPKDENPAPNENQLEALLKRAFNELISVCQVTKEEDARLRKEGLKDRMPDGWDWNTGSVWDRYKQAEIEIVSR